MDLLFLIWVATTVYFSIFKLFSLMQEFVVTKEAQEKVVSFPFRGQIAELKHGSVVIVAITGCTNTSNPSVMLGAGLVAKKACKLGLEWPAKVSRPAGIQYSGIWMHHMYWELGRS